MTAAKKKPIVYAVATGSYSDYRIEALFSNEKAAEAAADRIGGEIEEYPLYDSVPPRVTYYIIQQFPGRPVEERSEVREAWDRIYYEGTLIRGAAYQTWEIARGTAERAWGTNKEAVRRRWQEKHQQREAEEAGLL